MLDLAETQTNAITRETLRLMRKATAVVFRFDRTTAGNGLTRDNGFIRIYEQERSVDLWEHTIPADIIVRSYGPDHGQIKSGFAYLSNANYDAAWATIVHHVIRAGDVISLRFTAGGATTKDMQDAGFVGDYMDLVIHRPTSSGKPKVLTFRVYQQTSKQDSTARLIRTY